MNILDVLQELHIDYREHGDSPHVTAGWVGLVCPYCGIGTGKWGLGIPLNGARFTSCWKCGSHRLSEVLIDITGLPASKVFKLLGGTDFNQLRIEPRRRGKLVLPKGLVDLLPAHRKYLKSRGLDPNEVTRLWRLRGIGLAAKLSWRIWIPVVFHGSAVSWTTRAIGDSAVRYINARPDQESMSCKEVLFGEDLVLHGVIVTEGPFDAIKIGPGAVATLGTSFSQEQVTRLSKYPVRAVCFDADHEAQKRARALCRQLEVFPGKTLNILLDSKDPAECSPNELKLLRKCIA